MSWHCPRWTRNLTSHDNDFEDGDDCDEIYSNVRCSSFDADGWFVVDYMNSVETSELADDNSATCAEHDRSAEWDADFSAADDLREAGFVVCADCERTYHDQEAYGDHHGEEHTGDDVNTYMRNIPGRFVNPRPAPITTHSAW